MKKYSELFNRIFEKATADYHVNDNVDAPFSAPYPTGSLEYILYRKNWIDAVQWHLEDLIRDPHIRPEEALRLKRRIDRSNQERTDIVELLDEHFQNALKDVPAAPNASLNTESPAWAVDRLSILTLKIWHMREETEREDAQPSHRTQCQAKLSVLMEQQEDLSTAIDRLLDDLFQGQKRMKTYKQMKMYNDPELNPILYKPKEEGRIIHYYSDGRRDNG